MRAPLLFSHTDPDRSSASQSTHSFDGEKLSESCEQSSLPGERSNEECILVVVSVVLSNERVYSFGSSRLPTHTFGQNKAGLKVPGGGWMFGATPGVHTLTARTSLTHSSSSAPFVASWVARLLVLFGVFVVVRKVRVNNNKFTLEFKWKVVHKLDLLWIISRTEEKTRWTTATIHTKSNTETCVFDLKLLQFIHFTMKI